MKTKKYNKTNFGFTLIEMLIAITIVALLSSTVISMGSLVRDFRVGYVHKRLYQSIVLARSEAVKRNGNVTICRSTSGERCDSGKDWEDGWIVFYDENGNSNIDSNDKLIRVYNQISSSFKVRWTGPNKGFRFDSRGQVNATIDNKFTICLRNVADASIRTITVLRRGRGGRVESNDGRGSC